MNDILTTISTRKTPQSKQADKRQVPNSAGGFTFTIDPLAQARRFLVLGTDGPTYYTSAADLTVDNAQVIIKLAETNHKALVDLIVEVSEGGLAPKQNPTLFALAIACSIGTADEKRYALSMLSRVARTGTMLFLFARYVEQFRGWGRGLRKAVADWYLDKPVDRLAVQAVKYRQREGWTHRDLLRLAHPETQEPARRNLYNWIVKDVYEEGNEEAVRMVEAYKAVNAEGADIPALIREHNPPWEALPSDSLNDPKVWEALIERGLPTGALLRQLPRLTNLGLLTNMSDASKVVVDRLTNEEALKSARIHPIQMLIAQRTYAAGRGRSQSWTPVRKIVDALDRGFYASYGNVTPMDARVMLSLDISASMAWSHIPNTGITPRETSAAMALVTANVEDRYEINGFCGDLRPLAISPRQRLDDVIRTVSNLPMGRTDCAQPMLHALQRRMEIDTFVIYTDNETWAGKMHPHQALRQYRERMGINAKLIVVAMTPTRFSIADPTDPGMLDVAGFDASVPNLISDFGRVA